MTLSLRYFTLISCLLLFSFPAQASDEPAYSIEWLVGSASKAGIYKVRGVQIGTTSGKNSYTANVVEGGRLEGKMPATVVLQGGKRNVHPDTKRDDELLVFFNAKGGVRRSINLTSTDARGVSGSVITRDFQVIEDRDAILAKVTELLASQRKFEALHPQNAATVESPDYETVDIPAGTPAHGLFSDGPARLIVPVDPDAPATVTTTTTEVAEEPQGGSSLALFFVGVVVAALIVLMRARRRGG